MSDLLIIALVVLGGWVLSVVLFGPEGDRQEMREMTM